MITSKVAYKYKNYGGVTKAYSALNLVRQQTYIPKMRKKSSNMLPEIDDLSPETSKNSKYPISRQETNKTNANMLEQDYKTIILITDGDVCDIDATLHQVVRANALPISLIIIGVGDEPMKLNKKLF
jgi:hypothetical protein